MNWNMIGHEWAVHLLREHIVQNRMRQAYLITGPSGVGRRTLALKLAQSINCLQPVAPGDPCGVCSACDKLERMQHPDLAIVQAEQEGGTLKVEQVRELQRSLSLAPYEARYRVALLLRFEEANPSAANALLKTLEEPAPQVVLLLTAGSAESLLPTIVSRCEVLRLAPLPLEILYRALRERWQVPEENAQLLAHLCGGRPGYALRLHQQPDLFEQRSSWLEDLVRLLPASRVQRYAYVEGITKSKDNKENLRPALMVWLSFWRDVMLQSAGASTPIANQDWSDQIRNLAARLELHRSHQVVNDIEHTLELLDRNVNPRLALEVLFLDLPYLSAAA